MNEIELIDLKPDNYSKTVLIIGVFHGDEPDGEYLINRFLESNDLSFLRRQESHSLLNGISDLQSNFKNRLLFIPCLNSNGKALKQRTNANGVDLNRNFPTKCWELTERNEFFGGESPASEVETKFLMDVIDECKPDFILTLHAPYMVVNYDGPAEKVEKVVRRISAITGYPIQEDIGYPTPGSFGTYYGVERNIPVITLELPENEPLDELWSANKGVFEYFAMSY